MSDPVQRSVGDDVLFLDAWGKNPVRAKILKFYDRNAVLVEDVRGIRHYGGLWRMQDCADTPDNSIQETDEMKLGELRGLIRKTKGNPSIKTELVPGVTMDLALQKSPLLEELERAFPGGKTTETGLTFDEASGLLSPVGQQNTIVIDPGKIIIQGSASAEDWLLLDDTPAAGAADDDDLLV